MLRLWNGIEIQLCHKAFKKQGKRVERVCARTQQVMEKKKPRPLSNTLFSGHVILRIGQDILNMFNSWIAVVNASAEIYRNTDCYNWQRWAGCWFTAALRGLFCMRPQTGFKLDFRCELG
jgi:hypothetical protein